MSAPLLTDVQRQALEAELEQLERARTRMLTGQQVQQVTAKGKSALFAAGNITALQARIHEIERLLGRHQAGAIGVRF